MLSKIQTVRKGLLRVCDSVTLESGVTVPVVAGQCSQVDVISQNGYRYRKGFWDKVLSNPMVQEAILNRDVLGMIEHPEEDQDFLKTPYDGASHIILKSWVQDGNPFAHFGLLNNPEGNKIKALVDVGHRPGVSTRGLGSFGQDEESQFVEDDNYMFITWDIVKSPNFSELKMDKVTDSLQQNPLFRELIQMHHLKDSADFHYNSQKLVQDMDLVIKTLSRIKDGLINQK